MTARTIGEEAHAPFKVDSWPAALDERSALDISVEAMGSVQPSCAGTAVCGERHARRPVLIVEDHPLVANATSELLAKKDAGLDVVVCHTADEALRAVRATDWFRLFLDLDVPGAHGLSLVQQVVALGYGPRSSVITALDRPSLAAEVRALGLLGYIVKAIPISQFSAALDSVLRGEPTFPEAAMRSAAPVRLTRRQQELLALLQGGLSSKQIGVRLRISEGTVNNHIAGLLRVLRVSNRTHAVARATELGLLGVPKEPATGGR